MRKITAMLLMVAIMSVVTLALLEGVVAWSFWRPQLMLLPPPLARYLYVRFNRNTIQVMPECAVYDPQLTYTLRPGRCTFSNREFSNEIQINRAGLRDDDASLEAPDTIMLGDSLTMGWGVEQNESFPALFEQRTSRRTLNAGISSYGTVRELMLLTRLDRSAVRDLVIQHSDNDATENDTFLQAGSLRTLTQPEYDRTVEANRRSLAYFPGKYAFNVLVQLKNVIRPPSQEGGRSAALPPVERQAELFVSVLERSPVDISNLRVTVLSLDPRFIAAVKERASASQTPWLRQLRFVELDDLANVPKALYILDDHPTAVGYDHIAKALVVALSRS